MGKQERDGQASPLRNTLVACLMQRPFVELWRGPVFPGVPSAREVVKCVISRGAGAGKGWVGNARAGVEGERTAIRGRMQTWEPR